MMLTIKERPCVENKVSLFPLLDILLNNPRNQPHCDVPICINPCHNEANLILFAGEAVIVAAMGDCIDADVETDEDSALMDVCDRSGIFTLNLALSQIFFAGVTVYALDVCLYGNIFKGADFYA